MFDELFSESSTVERYRAAPLTQERLRYLRHCVECGFSRGSLELTASTQLRLVLLLDLSGDVKVSVPPPLCHYC